MNNLEKYNNSMTFTNILYDVSEIVFELDKKNKIKLTYLGNDNLIKTKSKMIKNNSKLGQYILQYLGYKNIIENELMIIHTKITFNTCFLCKQEIFDLNIVDFRNPDNIIMSNYEIHPRTYFTIGFNSELIYTFNQNIKKD